MKFKILIIIFFVGNVCCANMSSPEWRGTESAIAFSSKDIDISSENIDIHIDKDFNTAKYIVEYHVRSDVEGKQIPLLFFAVHYKDSFQVWVDNQPVVIINIPQDYSQTKDFPLSGFSDVFEEIRKEDPIRMFSISWDENMRNLYYLKDLKYFETDLLKGVHTIRVEYTAYVWEDVSDWIKKYGFYYSLTPAKYWKSFGDLTVTIRQSGEIRSYHINLGESNEGKIGAINTWKFDKLPDEYIALTFTPEVNGLARFLITIDPFGIMIVCGIILTTLHILSLKWYRRRYPKSKYSPVLILGSLLIPFLILICYAYSFEIIDSAIGQHAGNRGGYTFLVLFLYPYLTPVYGFFMWCVDQFFRNSQTI